MMADNERTTHHLCQQGGGSHVQAAEADIRNSCRIRRRKIDRRSIDIFHKNPRPSGRECWPAQQAPTKHAEDRRRTMTVIANPVINEKGERLGSVVQWGDRTAEVAVEHEVADLVSAAAAGDFSHRLNPSGKEGFFLQLAEGINKLVETSERGMNDVARVLKACRRAT
jgi:methyl-accepting chemotaxis protein